jgi:NAD-dependent histone deacetylase SIR2
LATHSLLHTCFTQNIDTLERRAGVPEDKIIEAHGSFASQRCINCGGSYDGALLRQKVMDKQIPRCATCGGLVKPDIVFFGESVRTGGTWVSSYSASALLTCCVLFACGSWQLPPAFARAATRLWEADLLIIMGTSLTVHPFASLANRVPSECLRVLFNLDQVGNIGSRADDVVVLGKCDEIVQELCSLLGWEDELQAAWADTAGSVDVGLETADVEEDPAREVEKLASEMERVLGLKTEAPSTEEAEAEAANVPESKEERAESNNDPDTADESPPPQPKLSEGPEQQSTSPRNEKEEPLEDGKADGDEANQPEGKV